MDVREAMAALPHPYAVALRLDDAGHPPTEIATALDIEADAVPMVLRLGRDKLARLLQAGDPVGPGRRASRAGPRHRHRTGS